MRHATERDPLADQRFAVPVRPKHFVGRRRLDDRLDASAELPLTLVSAPAGTGKTTLVAAWATRRSRPDAVAWLTLEMGDDRPGEFWPLVLACLGAHGVIAPLDVRSSGARRAMLTDLGAALARATHPVTLVLDGCDIADLGLAQDIEFVLGHCGRQLRLIVITRVDPVLPLPRFRLADSLAELRMADLAFTPDEAACMLEKAGVVLSPEAATTLVSRTRGWAAGLRFAAMHLAGSPDPDGAVGQLAGDTGNIAEYLMSEIMLTLAPQDRRLLLRTSVVDVLQPGLVEALAGRTAGRDLTALARANVLVEELSGRPGWYRYHPFLRDLLRAELGYSSASLLRRLRLRAGAWFAEQGEVPDAIAMAVAARAWPDAATYAVDGQWIGHLVAGDDIGGVVSALRPIPVEASGPHAAVVRAATALAGQDPERCAIELARCREVWDPAADETDALGVALEIVEAGLSASQLRSDELVKARDSLATPATGAQLIEPLTAKEREVLSHLSELLSTEEIAATMFVSVNTVRTHIRSILRKLAVSRRNDAVRRARALDLIGVAPPKGPQS